MRRNKRNFSPHRTLVDRPWELFTLKTNNNKDCAFLLSNALENPIFPSESNVSQWGWESVTIKFLFCQRTWIQRYYNLEQKYRLIAFQFCIKENINLLWTCTRTIYLYSKTHCKWQSLMFSFYVMAKWDLNLLPN